MQYALPNVEGQEGVGMRLIGQSTWPRGSPLTSLQDKRRYVVGARGLWHFLSLLLLGSWETVLNVNKQGAMT